MPFPNLCSVLFKSMPGTLALRLPHLLHTTVPIKFTGDYFAWLCFSQCSSFEQSVFFSDGVWLGGKNTFILSTIKKNPVTFTLQIQTIFYLKLKTLQCKNIFEIKAQGAVVELKRLLGNWVCKIMVNIFVL